MLILQFSYGEYKKWKNSGGSLDAKVWEQEYHGLIWSC